MVSEVGLTEQEWAVLSHIKRVTNSESKNLAEKSPKLAHTTTTRSGRVIRKPSKLDLYLNM